jgi:hypothetical protein
MIRIEPLTLAHFDRIRLQPAQGYISEWASPEIQEGLAAQRSQAFVDGDEVLLVGGAIEMWEGRGVLWSLLSGSIGHRFPAVHRLAQRFIAGLPFRRLEATVDVGFTQGERWVDMLGFRLETPCMRGYLPNGGDAAMYVRGV